MKILILASAVSTLKTYLDKAAAYCSNRLILEYNLLRDKRQVAVEQEHEAKAKCLSKYREAKASLASLHSKAEAGIVARRKLKVSAIEAKLEAIDEAVDTLNY